MQTTPQLPQHHLSQAYFLMLKPALLLPVIASVLLMGCQSTKVANPSPSITTPLPAPLSTQGAQTTGVPSHSPQVNTPTLPSSTLPANPLPSTVVMVNSPNANLPLQFNITGKIGIVSPNQTVTAFYNWAQQNVAFGISLVGALGIGQSTITYDGKTAQIVSDKINNPTHTLTAASPEELLYRTSKLHAPLSQLPYWILGKFAPTDSQNQLDTQGRLSVAYNRDWIANFSYENNKTLPNKIIMRKTDTATGKEIKVTLTINPF